MKEKSKHFTDLLVWKAAHELVLYTYKMTKKFPKEEIFGLTAQLRRAAVSIPANIAEGFARNGIIDKLHFYNIASGSVNEVSYYLILLKDPGYAAIDIFCAKTDEISKMLISYSKAMQPKY